MANQIIPLVWEKPLRKSAVNTLDKVNELVDFINDSDIHEFSFIERGTGESVQTGTSTQLADLTVYGKSVQDGTPTPDNPVPVQVVGGYNLLKFQTASQYTVNSDGTITLNSTGGFNIKFDALPEGKYWVYARIVSGSASGTNLLTVAGITYYYDDLGTSKQFVNAIAPSQIWVSGNANFTVGTTLEIMLTANQCTAFAPYDSIGLQIGETVTPIDMQGHTLAGLPDGTRDELDIDAAGVKTIGQRVGVVDLGTLTWTYDASTARFIAAIASKAECTATADGIRLACANYAARTPTYFSAPSSSFGADVMSECYSSGHRQQIMVADARYTDAATFKAAMSGVLLYYELAEPQTIELGYITPPAIPSGSVVSIDATLTPTIDLAWWTEEALPQVIDSLKGYVDSKIAEVNTRIDTLHGVSPAYTQIINSPDKLADIDVPDELTEEKEI